MGSNNVYFELGEKQKRWLKIFMAWGLLVFLWGLVSAPERSWLNLLLSGVFLTSIAFCGIMFVAMHYVSNSGWQVALRRIPEAMFSVMPLSFIIMLSLYLGLGHIYEWSHKEIMLGDDLLRGKIPWLNPTAFMARMVLYFIFWYGVGIKIIKHSLRQDKDGEKNHTVLAKRWSSLWLYVGGIMFILSSFDWIMSLEPHWFSTIFGLYNFAGMFTSGLAVIIVILIFLRRQGVMVDVIKNDHLHELGRYLFSFTAFWVYIWFCQHMLIWYANIPEETVYYIKRHVGVFGALTVLNVCLNWLIPFLILLFRKTKRNEKWLLMAAGIVLVGRWMDLYLMIFPAKLETPIIGLAEVSIFAGALAAFAWIFFKTFGNRNLVPLKDPYLKESTALHT